ncbi:MAG TPA: ABC transporter permease [Dongiaceae bacterium]|nr:ABC transporter permease [Dongiaceae bacterium]
MILTRSKLGLFRYVLYGHALLVTAFLLLPIVFIALLSLGSSRWLAFPPPAWTFKWYEELASDPRWMESLWLSLRLALCVTILSVLLGGAAAFALARGKFRGRRLLKAFFVSPMIAPVVIVAIALYSFSLKMGLNGTFIGFVAGHLIVAVPFSVICIVNSLRSFDLALEQAAAICGAGRLQTLRRVTIPCIAPGVMAAAIFSFLASWDEVVISIFMASPQLQTLPVRMWTSLRMDLTPVIAAVSTLLVLASMLLMVVLGLVFVRRSPKQ